VLRGLADLMSKDYSAEFKRRFADGNTGGVTITMMEHEFDFTKLTVKLLRERIDQGGAGTIDRPRKNNRYPGALASRRRSLSAWQGRLQNPALVCWRSLLS